MFKNLADLINVTYTETLLQRICDGSNHSSSEATPVCDHIVGLGQPEDTLTWKVISMSVSQPCQSQECTVSISTSNISKSKKRDGKGMDMSSKAKITPPIGAEKVQAKPMAQAANSSFETVEPTSLEPPAGWQLVDGWVLSVVEDCGWIRLNVKFISIHPLLSSSLVVIHWLGESTNS